MEGDMSQETYRKPDFRDDAEAGTIRTSGDLRDDFSSIHESGCIRVAETQVFRWCLELATLTVSTICLINSVLILPLKLLGFIPGFIFVPVLLIGLAILLVMRKIKSMILKSVLVSRPGSLLKEFSDLPARAIGLEDGKTCKKIKILTEDEGFCIMDSENRRLLIEGYLYRYVIYADDVRSVTPVSAYALGGADIKCKVGGEPLHIVLAVAGQGPLASIVEAFNPHENATGLSGFINQTLFNSPGPSYQNTQTETVLPKQAPAE
jgi:hypothetical protein